MTNRNTAAFKEISNWKLEAKFEDTDRYFYMTSDVESLLRGDKSYIIGRKGTGKTAIANFIKHRSEFNHFSIDLSLKNFPFNKLYNLKDGSYTPPNEYITIWKYIIYTNLLYLMVENNSIDEHLRADIRQMIPCDPKAALSTKISEWTSGSFCVGFDGLSGSVGVTKAKESVDLTWMQRSQVLEKIILDNLDDSKYFILFDELDEDYKYQSVIEGKREYLDLITGLFKAVQDIKSISFNNGLNINPVVFLRDDIYDIIQDPDKTKWSDLSIDLKWTKFTMQPLIAYRLSRSIDRQQNLLSFPHVWNRFFSNNDVGTGVSRRKPMTIFDWISRNTLLRPRDYIKFLQLCAKKSYESGYAYIGSGLVTTQDISYSRYFRSEIVDELHSLLPDINNVFDVISKIGKSQFSVEEFGCEYQKSYESGLVKNPNYEFILNVLFVYSVIGNHSGASNKFIFRYINHEANINLDWALVVHRGLFKSMQLF